MAQSVSNSINRHRSNLIGLVYRITGSVSEAEDIVQETFLKWINADQKSVTSPYSWLVTVATRLSLDHLKSARVQRQSYIGPWLPEPFIADNETPEKERELDESITMALLVVLDGLSPSERAVFILHDLFHFNFKEIGNILNKTAPSCRKLASRARAKMNKDTLSPKSDKNEYLDIASAFFGAIKRGDISDLISMLQENVAFHSDGGGKAPASLEILSGIDAVVSFLMDRVRPSFITANTACTGIKYTWFNGSPGFVIRENSAPVSAFNFKIKNHRIEKIYVLRNPDKLKFFDLN